MALDPQTRLQRTPELTLRIDSSNYVVVDGPDGEITCGPHGLAVLETFSQPTTFQDALETLKARVVGTQDWISLTNTIVQLHQYGVLQDATSIRPTIANSNGFDAAPIHAQMLNDYERTAQFIAGLEATVQPGQVVLDIGTGTGVLAVAAARAGARHVYAVEASSMGPCAQTVFDANGLRDRITLVPGWSTAIDLPEPADVLVTETIGNEPLSEQLLEIVLDAKRRLLKPDAQILPSRLRIMALPLSLPEAALSNYTFTPTAIADWKRRYDIDFSTLGDIARHAPHSFYVKPHRAQAWPALTDPIVLSEITLATADTLHTEQTITATANQAGQLNGLMIYADIELGTDRWLRRHPSAAGERCSWRSPVWVVMPPLDLKPGDRIAVTYRYRVPGTNDSVQVARA